MFIIASYVFNKKNKQKQKGVYDLDRLQIISMTQVVERGRAANARRVTKFSFSDYRFAAFVRERMLEVLTQFDANQNQCFEEEEIKQALVQILNENPNELHYVVQNVFRYDKDSDGRVTYKQFIDFSVEQHFGEMAIQRLHRQNMYSQGAKRIMNLQEFINTVEYSLNPIEVFGSNEIYQMLFQELDLDRDGFISYEDYFIFLKEYFGTLSPINDDTNREPAQPQPKQPDYSIDNRATERFARLIYSQLKITAMQLDTNRKLVLQPAQINVFLEEVLQMNESERDYVAGLALKGQPHISYDAFLQFIVPFYFCQYFVSAVGLEDKPINLSTFVNLGTKASSMIVAVPPSQKTLTSIFYLAAGQNVSELDLDQYVLLMGNIFQNFSFDKRGLARGASH